MRPVLNVTALLEDLVRSVVAGTEEFSHIDPARLLLCVSSARSSSSCGVYAKIHPLRFPGGSRTGVVRRRGRNFRCEMPPIIHGGNDILYIIYFLVPRFLDLPLREKLVTLFHELYHVSPDFDGDIRRFKGRNFAHGHSRRKFNLKIEEMVEKYLATHGAVQFASFLESGSGDLRKNFRSLIARKMPVPRLKPL